MIKYLDVLPVLLIELSVIYFSPFSSAQFADNFNTDKITYDESGNNGWTFRTGDGNASMKFISSGKGYASIYVDASKDKRGIWWALIRRRVSENMDLKLLRDPRYELRIEARIKISDAPKRVNLHLNTQRTTDFHSNLMEYDIPDTANWHTISMTTHNFDAVPGDTVYAQMALMDWGPGQYRVDIDYYKADIVKIDSAGKDKGFPIPYHPPVIDAGSFSNHIVVEHDAIVDLEFPELNFNNWVAADDEKNVDLLTVDGTKYIIMRWDLSKFKGKKIKGSGLLETTSYSLQRSADYLKDFGMIRVSEILSGDVAWNQDNVTYNSFCKGKPRDKVINSQMIIDVDVNKNKNGKNYIAISQPVMQRLIDGKTLGIAIKPLGAVNASFYSMENKNENLAPKIHFNIISE